MTSFMEFMYDQSYTNTDDGSETPVAHRPYNVAFARALIVLYFSYDVTVVVITAVHDCNIAHNHEE